MSVSIERINERLRQDAHGFIAGADEDYLSRVRSLAEDIQKNKDIRPIVLISGPSGSGKTTTALLVEQFLDSWGCNAHTLSMDNYFTPFNDEQKEMALRGEIDLESPQRMDIDFMNEQLDMMLACQRVEIPKYDFMESKRVYNGSYFERHPGEIVILEGIHALNPEVITLSDDVTERVYISVRTRTSVCGKTIHPSRLRLLRRMARDNKFRSRNYRETLDMLDRVEAGEEKYIMPYKVRTTHNIDTFLPYEPGVYRDLMLDDLEAVDDDRLDDVIALLRSADAVPDCMVPHMSLIREFIGNGRFEY